jgi:hypothetical protein
MKKQSLLLGLLAIVFSLAIFACGGNTTSTESTEQPATEQPAAEPATEAAPAPADTTAAAPAQGGEQK